MVTSAVTSPPPSLPQSPGQVGSFGGRGGGSLEELRASQEALLEQLDGHNRR